VAVLVAIVRRTFVPDKVSLFFFPAIRLEIRTGLGKKGGGNKIAKETKIIISTTGRKRNLGGWWGVIRWDWAWGDVIDRAG